MAKAKHVALTNLVRVELSLVRESDTVPARIRTPEDVSKYADRLRTSDREQFAVVLLTSKNDVIGLHVCSIGILDASLVSPANVFKPALLANAARLVLAHQHPSGDPTPSAEDIRITRQLVEAGRIMDIGVQDHVVLGRGDTYVSLREQGLTDFST